MLDVGCGIGGGDFYMSEQYGVHVHGVDLSVNMVLIALEKAVERHGDVTFEVADATARDFGAGAYDVVYSRDTILHVQVGCRVGCHVGGDGGLMWCMAGTASCMCRCVRMLEVVVGAEVGAEVAAVMWVANAVRSAALVFYPVCLKALQPIHPTACSTSLIAHA